MKRRKALWEVKHPETKNGGTAAKAAKARWDAVRQIGEPHNPEPAKPAERFTKTVAAITGRGERTIQREIQRAETLHGSGTGGHTGKTKLEVAKSATSSSEPAKRFTQHSAEISGQPERNVQRAFAART